MFAFRIVEILFSMGGKVQNLMFPAKASDSGNGKAFGLKVN